MPSILAAGSAGCRGASRVPIGALDMSRPRRMPNMVPSASISNSQSGRSRRRREIQSRTCSVRRSQRQPADAALGVPPNFAVSWMAPYRRAELDLKAF